MIIPVYCSFSTSLLKTCFFSIHEVHFSIGLKTTAVKKGGDYVINGGKMWITNGAQADWMCLLANTSEGPAHRNKSLICLPMNLPGKFQSIQVIFMLGVLSLVYLHVHQCTQCVHIYFINDVKKLILDLSDKDAIFGKLLQYMYLT